MAKRKSVVMYGAWAGCAAISAGLLFAGGKASLAEPMANAAGGTGTAVSKAATRPYSPPVRFANED